MFNQFLLLLRGEASLTKAVIANLVAITVIGLVLQYMISTGYISRIEKASTVKELFQVLFYYILVLPFDYIVWVCSRNAKSVLYKVLGRVFALKHIAMLVVSLYRFFAS